MHDNNDDDGMDGMTRNDAATQHTNTTNGDGKQFQVDSMEQERRRVRRLLSLLWVVGVFFCFFPLFVFAR